MSRRGNFEVFLHDDSRWRLDRLAITTHPPRCCEDHARLVAVKLANGKEPKERLETQTLIAQARFEAQELLFASQQSAEAKARAQQVADQAGLQALAEGGNALAAVALAAAALSASGREELTSC